MRVVVMCMPDEFCMSQTETGGEYGVPLEIYCMDYENCRYPDKKCLYRKRLKENGLAGGVGGKFIPISEDHFMNPDSLKFDPDADAHDPERE